jgi:AraC-like DNA-binding protein
MKLRPQHFYFDEINKSAYFKLLDTQSHLLYAGILTEAFNWCSKPDKHDFFEFLYIRDGKGTVYINDNSFLVKSGDLLFYNKGVMHWEKPDEEDPFKFVFFAYDYKKSLTDEPAYENNIPALNHAGVYRFRLEAIFSELLNESSNLVDGYEIVCAHLLPILIMQIIRICNIISNKHDPSSTSQMLKEFIDSNFTQNLTLDTLSEVVYVSKDHLSHMFKNEIGMPPITYMINKRMTEAKILLRTLPDMSINEISKKIGYENSNYFSQLFKKCEGLSPIAYRNKFFK